MGGAFDVKKLDIYFRFLPLISSLSLLTVYGVCSYDPEACCSGAK